MKTFSQSSDILYCPVKLLAKLSMQNLKESQTLERASKSILYQKEWRSTGIRPDKIKTYKDFTKIPYLTSRNLQKVMREDPIEKVLCSNEVVHWFSTTGTTGKSKWIPYGRRDIDLFMKIRDRSYNLLPRGKGLKGLAISAPAPFIEDMLVNFNMISNMLMQVHIENVSVSHTEAENEDTLSFALDMKPNIIAAFPSFAARLAEIIEERAPEIAREEFRKHKSPRTLAAYLVTRIKKIQPKDLSKFKWGIFGGEPLDPYRKILKKTFSLDPYEMYLFTEFIPPAIECLMHNGMHIWMDICIPEIIPESELDREKRNKYYVPKAVYLGEAEEGLKGEYVVTTFGEALPLIRYRLGDLIQVISTSPCQCGITHPRIKVIRRSDNTICLGPIRFSAEELEEKILFKTKYGKAKRWQLKITRENYRPKSIIRIEPSGKIDDEKSFLQEISMKVKELEILRIGIENKLVAEPLIKLDEKISDKGRSVTKSGRIIYEGENGEFN